MQNISINMFEVKFLAFVIQNLIHCLGCEHYFIGFIPYLLMLFSVVVGRFILFVSFGLNQSWVND